ncbi:unnamed protein product [Adineta steineri]|uniref:Uncharacterized protein n=2 Tax=Adineta steineri TaxID=433720 RepID=A0A814XZP9_9BILA|nr:unnamed protein product [Adineta steineri]
MTNTVLKVALYPYLPDSAGDNYESLLQFITVEFKKIYPNITLLLRPISFDDDFYNLDVLTKWLKSDGSGYDVVEVDTELLGDLVNAGLITPQFSLSHNHSDWHSAAATAVQFNQAVYGFPHYMCALFLFTRDDKIASANTIDQLVHALGSTTTNNYRLVGNLASSWDLPSMWISSYQNSISSGTDEVAFALHSYSNNSFETMSKLARLCDRIGEINHCLNGTFNGTNYEMPALLFARNQTAAMFDYSERLFFILKNGSLDDYHNVKVIPLPTGKLRNQPIFFSDAFVFRRNMSEDVLEAARSFADFMGTPRMQAAVVGSGDSPGSIPRYLLPMSISAYNEPLLANNRFYQTYFRHLTGLPYPTIGLSNTRLQLQAAILNYIN